MLIIGLLSGVLITAPIIKAESFITDLMPLIPAGGVKFEAFYMSFLVASLVEELFKYIVLIFLIWKNKNFNEKFDGIVYSVFISLGFAGIENVLYVINPELGGIDTALSRAFISIPAHALFGVIMGYYFALAKFEPEKRTKFIIYAFLIPFLVHGFYDFILLSEIEYMMIVFLIFLVYLWMTGFKKMKKHLQSSPFKNTTWKIVEKAIYSVLIWRFDKSEGFKWFLQLAAEVL